MDEIVPTDDPRFGKKERPKRSCHKCGSTDIAEILWGMPAQSEELFRALDAGEITLGGCVVEEDAPRWECANCGHKWGRARA